jgi:hypothetical protein
VDVDRLGFAFGLPLAASVPPFEKGPTSSFFFESTEINGFPCFFAPHASFEMCSSWPLRSACYVPSSLLRVDCRL